MTGYKQIYCKFWTDTKVQEEMTANDRYLFLYFITNPLNNILGCYEIGLKHIELETGLSREEITESISHLTNVHCIDYEYSSNEVLIKNYAKHNWNKSPKLDPCILKELPNVRSAEHKSYLAQLYNSRETVKEPYYE